MYLNKSILGAKWQIKKLDNRDSLMISQKHNLPLTISQLLTVKNVKNNDVNEFLEPNLNNNLPNPLLLKDMDKAVSKTVEILAKNQKIGIITDYDVDGSTSAAILSNFLTSIGINFSIKVPNRLNEGYGPNKRLLDELISENASLIFTLDCGTTSFDTLNFSNSKFRNIIIIDHHISELKLPDVYAVINPNRYDENNSLKELAAVGVTFLFLMALRKKLREIKFFNNNIKEPNLLSYLDLVALGTVCDVVKLTKYNRSFVSKGLEIIKKRSHLGISKMIDNSKLNHSPTSIDLGYVIGPQLNAASRIDDSTLSSKILISKNTSEIDIISKKLILLNEKRKLIENEILDQCFNQAKKQINKKFILVFGFGWHKGVLGIIASKLVEKYNKPSFVISVDNDIGIGSGRSINKIDIGKIVLNAKYNKLLINGGGHKMAAGIMIKKNLISDFDKYLTNSLSKISMSLFEKTNYFDLKISINNINDELLKYIEKFEPFGNGNEEISFIISDIKIEKYKIIKDKHLVVFLENDFGDSIKGICFNSIGSLLADNFINNKSAKYDLSCNIKRDNFDSSLKPQLIIRDAMIIN